MPRSRPILARVAGALALGLGACGRAGGPDAPLVRVVARDYAFEAPAQVPAGALRVRLVNRGAHWHHAVLVRLDATTASAYLAAVQAGDSLPAGATDVGGPALAAAGDSSEVRLALRPGRYLLACWTSGGLGRAHIKGGMARELVVAAPTAAAADDAAPDAGPAADVVVRLTDYAFEVAPRLAPGRRVVRVENAGRDYHELDLVRLAPGATGAAYWAWKEAHQAGPAPGTPVGGTSDFAPGGRAWFTADLAPGRYLLICDMQMAAHRMMSEVEVR